MSDDGSAHDTLRILVGYEASCGADRLQILRGPRHGFVCNFLLLLCNPAIQADYLGFADQDDVWLPDKLEHAMSVLKSYPGDRPALYCSRTFIIDDFGVEQGQSLLKHVKPSSTTR